MLSTFFQAFELVIYNNQHGNCDLEVKRDKASKFILVYTAIARNSRYQINLCNFQPVSLSPLGKQKPDLFT